VLIYADITERKRSEAEIRAARDAAEEASRTIEAACELKTPGEPDPGGEDGARVNSQRGSRTRSKSLNFVNNFAALSVDLLSELKEAAA
jgi:hypothetical protein